MDERWFKDGLNFECTACGKCCQVPQHAGGEAVAELSFPGAAIADEEVVTLAAHLNLTEEEFRRQFVTICRQGFQSLILRDGACVFYDKGTKLCAVHEARPSHCKAFPFYWNTNARMFWDAASSRCEGINRGPLISEEEIVAALRGRRPNVYPNAGVGASSEVDLAADYEKKTGLLAVQGGKETPEFKLWCALLMEAME